MNSPMTQEEATGLQTIFKTQSLRASCVAIAVAAKAGEFWPDEVDLSLPKADRNCIGNAYKLMKDTLGVIALAEPHVVRRSKSGPSRGHLIRKYRTVDFRLARTIARLAPSDQLDLISN
ncbi:hypothetical protein SAMN05444156_3246 [Verrucomicrobium sp. GAS474]|uniref:hypothetical protein n=1 Tax=Verrucomicrobium sp. GAS474 TaxID=1882831 RepID=UPI00087B157B|nr:hypothetical protein [Verrucomicrobium sp. GAS474]SDT85642.1 hypothetical protein SAMN05444156_0008 [Verrucomicrobium sp. GAS474]SDU31521.1 hypothetical protein SAMN05444156_3246 [Verrucomicrobium sp. GAS474]